MLQEQSDEIKKIQEGHIETFQKLFNQFFPAISSFAGKMVKDFEVGEDIAQNVFVRLWELRESYDNINSIKSFLYQIARNESINYLKHKEVQSKHRNIEVHTHSKEDFLKDVIKEEVRRKIYFALQQLPSQSKKVIELNINGLSNIEIAEDLDISPSTVKTLKYRSYKSLREILKNIFSFFF